MYLCVGRLVDVHDSSYVQADGNTRQQKSVGVRTAKGIEELQITREVEEGLDPALRVLFDPDAFETGSEYRGVVEFAVEPFHMRLAKTCIESMGIFALRFVDEPATSSRSGRGARNGADEAATV